MKNTAQREKLITLLDSYLVTVWEQGDKWQDALVSHLSQRNCGWCRQLIKVALGKVESASVIRDILNNTGPEPWDYRIHVNNELAGSTISEEELAGIHRTLDQLIRGSTRPSTSQSPIEEDGQCVYVLSNLQL